MALELVMLVPVLVLLTVFVLWAGRGGRAALTADLAAEEAATAAALCCEEDAAGEPDRELLVEEMLAARPGLEFLCVGGARPEAPADGGGPDEFVRERWLDFEFGSARARAAWGCSMCSSGASPTAPWRRCGACSPPWTSQARPQRSSSADPSPPTSASRPRHSQLRRLTAS